MPRYILFFTVLTIFGLAVLSGCQKSVPPEQLAASAPIPETTDSACAYFYYLWGSHAESTGRYDESLQAYQKALVCDPDAEDIKEKIPLLLIKSGDKAAAIEYLKKQLEENPDLIEQRLILASLYLQENRSELAINLYKEVLQINPDREDVLLRLGLIYSQQKRDKLAEEIFLDLIAKNNELYYGHLYLARLYLKTRRYDDAIFHYGTALSLNWSTDLIHEIAAFYKATRDYVRLIQLYDDFIQSNPYDEIAQYGLVEALLQVGQEDEAVRKLKAMKAYVRSPFTIDLIISKINISRNEIEEAVTRLRGLLDSPVSSEAKFLLALLFAQDDQQLALSYLEGIENDFNDFENAIYLQTKLFKAVNRVDDAIAVVRKQLADEANRRPSFYSILSALYQVQENYQQSLEVLQEGVLVYPKDIDLHFELSLLYEQIGMREMAVLTMEKVLALQPNNAEALNFVGYIWADANINLNKALQYIEKAYALKPESGYIRDSLGWIHYRLGNLTLAKSHLEAAAQMEKDDPHILDHLGDVYRELANYEMAIGVYLKAIDGYTNEEDKNKVQKKIDAITNK